LFLQNCDLFSICLNLHFLIGKNYGRTILHLCHRDSRLKCCNLCFFIRNDEVLLFHRFFDLLNVRLDLRVQFRLSGVLRSEIFHQIVDGGLLLSNHEFEGGLLSLRFVELGNLVCCALEGCIQASLFDCQTRGLNPFVLQFFG